MSPPVRAEGWSPGRASVSPSVWGAVEGQAGPVGVQVWGALQQGEGGPQDWHLLSLSLLNTDTSSGNSTIGLVQPPWGS